LALISFLQPSHIMPKKEYIAIISVKVIEVRDFSL
jgi:hypothetical protein